MTCHCEEGSDEAIPSKNEIATPSGLAMTSADINPVDPHPSPPEGPFPGFFQVEDLSPDNHCPL
jgi:hypothetical protein